jgi:hypothetical protein
LLPASSSSSTCCSRMINSNPTQLFKKNTRKIGTKQKYQLTARYSKKKTQEMHFRNQPKLHVISELPSAVVRAGCWQSTPPKSQHQLSLLNLSHCR